MSKVAKIPLSFIKEYVEKQGMKEVMVEFENKEIDCPDGIEGCEVLHMKEMLKLDSNGCIIIHSAKEDKLEVLKNILEKAGVRKYLNINNFGYSQVERDIVEALTNP